jgi:hypothetical protein
MAAEAWHWLTTVFLTNAWWGWVWQNYSVSIAGFPVFAALMLKLAAIVHPGIPSDKIIDLITQYWPSAAPTQADVNKRQAEADKVQVDIDKDQKAVGTPAQPMRPETLKSPFGR